MTKKIKIPIYDEVIILSDDLDLLHKIDEESKEYDISGAVIYDKAKLCMFIFDKTHSTISHEIFHAVCRISEIHCLECEEAKAYLLGFISEKVYKILEDNKHD